MQHRPPFFTAGHLGSGTLAVGDVFLLLVSHQRELLLGVVALLDCLVDFLVLLHDAFVQLLLTLFELFDFAFQLSSDILKGVELIDQRLNMVVLLLNVSFQTNPVFGAGFQILLQAQNLIAQDILLFCQRSLCRKQMLLRLLCFLKLLSQLFQFAGDLLN